MRVVSVTLLTGMLVTILAMPAQPPVTAAALDTVTHISPAGEEILAPVWRSNIRQWSRNIQRVAKKHQLDPDLIAAVVLAESHGDPAAISVVGAVGLMGIMPVEAGFSWRPTTEALKDPYTNLDWGTAILADILRQAGGDLYTALAAYNGGWYQIDGRVPQGYAAEVLHYYGQAVAARSGVSPDIASEWSVAVKITRGNIPPETLLLGKQPYGDLMTVGEHLLIDYVDDRGQALYVRAFAVPIGLVASDEVELFGASDTVEELLLPRLGLGDGKSEGANLHVLLACLPALERLRERFTVPPSNCPETDR